MIRKQIAGLLVVTALIAGSASIYKDSRPPQSEDGVITLRMAQTSSETGAIGQSMNAFADKIYERTGGKYKIEVYHNGQLGAEIDTIEGCQMYRARADSLLSAAALTRRTDERMKRPPATWYRWLLAGFLAGGTATALLTKTNPLKSIVKLIKNIV